MNFYKLFQPSIATDNFKINIKFVYSWKGIFQPILMYLTNAESFINIFFDQTILKWSKFTIYIH